MTTKIRDSQPQTTQGPGLGDAVEVVAKPIAKALGLPVDCAPCARRKARLNAISARASARVRRLFAKPKE